VRFLRQLAAVTVLVAAVVVIGLAWHHFAPGSLGGQGGVFVARGRPVKGLPQGAKRLHAAGPTVTPGVQLNTGASGVPPIQLGDLLQPVNLVVLRNTAQIEAEVIAAVVIVDWGLRKRRRARRAALAGLLGEPGFLGKHRVAPLAVPHRLLLFARRPASHKPAAHEERADPAGVREPVAGDRVPEADDGGDEQRD
jgi:hypothetical protein